MPGFATSEGILENQAEYVQKKIPLSKNTADFE